MKKLVVLLLVSIMATSAFAQLDTDPNSLGVYFDLAGTSNHIPVLGASTPTFAYVLAMNTTEPFNGVEFSYNIQVPVGMEGMIFRLLNSLPAGAVDLGSNDGVLTGDYFYGLAAPIAPGPVVTVVTWQFLLLAGGIPMEFYLGAAPIPSIPEDLPGMEIGGSIIPMGLASGDPLLPVAGINTADAPVAEETTSFGGVKALFR